MTNRPFAERIGFAIEGWRTGWARENSFRAQARLGAMTFVAPVVGAAMVVETGPRFLVEVGIW